jgi:hypothetical protein
MEGLLAGNGIRLWETGCALQGRENRLLIFLAAVSLKKNVLILHLGK